MHDKDAVAELLRHAGLIENYYEEGFLGCLRPYTGIKAENFHAVVEALLAAASTLAPNHPIDRQIARSAFKITIDARRFAIDKEGVLVRNKLISEEDQQKLRRWITIIENLILELLSGKRPYEAIHGYCSYVVEFGWGANADAFVPLLTSAIQDDSFGDRLAEHCDAIAHLPPSILERHASTLLTTLGHAREKNWQWYDPHTECQAEMLDHIDMAIKAINLKFDS